jgi:hypothetical protein
MGHTSSTWTGSLLAGLKTTKTVWPGKIGVCISTDDQYKNKRTEMWCLMAAWLRSGGAIPNIVDLKQDLASPIYFYDAANKICLESKNASKPASGALQTLPTPSP